TQHAESFASHCADLLDTWAAGELPRFFQPAPEDEDYRRCLASAVDYFSAESVEHRLLHRGVALHHGSMPAHYSRRLKALIDRGILRVIVATSTLSEG